MRAQAVGAGRCLCGKLAAETQLLRDILTTAWKKKKPDLVVIALDPGRCGLIMSIRSRLSSVRVRAAAHELTSFAKRAA